MSLLKNLTSDTSIADEKDVIGGGGVLDSGLYRLKVTLAYLELAKSGALAVNVRFVTDTGRELRQQFWVQSGVEKGNKNYYEKDGERHYLPGFIMANALSLLTLGRELNELDTEKKVVKLYNYDAKAEVPTAVEVITDLIGQEIVAGVIKQVVDKRAKADDGSYYPTGETREENEIDKFFRASDYKTTAEIRAQADASFYKIWENKWAGKVRDRSSKDVGKAGAPTPKAAAKPATPRPTNSLFA